MRPPLADGLFDQRAEFGEIIDRYPQVRALVPRLRDAAVNDTVSIEQVFEGIVSEAHDRVATRRQLAAAQFYIHDAIETSVERFAFLTAHGVTNYHELVNRIDVAFGPRGTPVVYVTFNYDQLIETALDDALGHQFHHIDDYVNDPSRRVFKLHGSVNWRRLAERVDGAPTEYPWINSSHKQNVAWLLARTRHCGQRSCMRLVLPTKVPISASFFQRLPSQLRGRLAEISHYPRYT